MKKGLASRLWFEFWCRNADNDGNNTRQGYARKRTLKPAGYFFLKRES
jgi:hypothetical protein